MFWLTSICWFFGPSLVIHGCRTDSVEDKIFGLQFLTSMPQNGESHMNEPNVFRNRRLPREDFRGSEWSGHDFTGSVLFCSKFQSCVMKRSLFNKADLQGANFSEAVCTESDFSGADFTDAILDYGDFRHCIFDGAIFSETSILRADFSGSTFIKTDLRFQDLSGADFFGCSFVDAILP